MRFLCDQTVLQKTIESVKPSRKPISYGSHSLSNRCITFRLAGDKLRVMCVGRDLSIETECDVVGQEDGEAHVFTDVISPVVRGLDGTIEFHRQEDSVSNEGFLEVKSTNTVLHVRCVKADDIIFSAGSEDDDVTNLKIDGSKFHSACQKVMLAASDDQTRAILTGVHMGLVSEGGNEKVVFAATDTYRLVVAEVAGLAERWFDAELIVPADAIHSVRKLMEDAKTINMEASSNLVRFSDGVSSVQASQIAGSFPEYRSLIPEVTDKHRQVTIDASELRSAIRRASLANKEKTPKIKCEFEGTSTLHLSVDDAERGNGKAVLPVTAAAEIDHPLSFNMDYFNDVTNVFGESFVLIVNAVERSKPVLCRAGSDESDDGIAFQYLLMPYLSPAAPK